MIKMMKTASALLYLYFQEFFIVLPCEEFDLANQSIHDHHYQVENHFCIDRCRTLLC